MNSNQQPEGTQVNVRLIDEHVAMVDSYAKDYGLTSRAAAVRSMIVQLARLQAERAGIRLQEGSND